MPVHDWRRVEAGIFHAFHHDWITEIARALNRGILPTEYYALPEQIAGGLGPDILALHRPDKGVPSVPQTTGGILLAESPPKVQRRLRAELDQYAAKAKTVVIRHSSNHEVIAVVEIVSPGNKNNRRGLRSFVEKAEELLRAGVHLLVVDLFPPGPFDAQGMHKAIWDQIIDNDFILPEKTPLTLAAYVGGAVPEAFIEPTAVNLPLAEMPLFLNSEVYVQLPLEATYQLAFEGLATYWREVLSA
jgi:hypothetical protein